MPAMPLFGSGEVRLQPVYVEDVAAAVAAALATPEAAGKLYELGGPRVYTYKALVQLVLERTGRRRLLLPVPYSFWLALAALMAPLPQRPISRDQVKLMQKDNVVSPGALAFADLGISATPLETVAPSYLRRAARRFPWSRSRKRNSAADEGIKWRQSGRPPPPAGQAGDRHRSWGEQPGSNRRPPGPQPGALTD